MGNENSPVEGNQESMSSTAQTRTTTNNRGVKNRQAATATFPTSSARIKGDTDLAKIATGGTVSMGNRGATVRKLHQLLIDMGYMEALNFDVSSNVFGPPTYEALVKFQQEATGITKFKKGVFDAATLGAMDQRLGGRQDYVQAAQQKNETKGVRPLDDKDKKALSSALEPTTAEQEGKTFTREESRAYRTALRKNFALKFKTLHKESQAKNKKALLKNSKKRDEKQLFQPKEVENPANVAAEVVNQLYGNLTGKKGGGKVFTYGKNLIDIWEESATLLEKNNWGEKAATAKDWAPYLVQQLSEEVNAKYGRSSSDNLIMKTLAAEICDSKEEVNKLLEIQQAWEGTETEGIVSIQRYKATTKTGNTKKMWEVFYTAMHEYLHKLAHPNFEKWAASTSEGKEHALTEGFCDFFVLNVCARFPPEKLKPYQQRVEGNYYNKTKPTAIPSIHQASSVYGAVKQAEQAVGVVGIANVQQAYFKGMVSLMGGTVPKKKK